MCHPVLRQVGAGPGCSGGARLASPCRFVPIPAEAELVNSWTAGRTRERSRMEKNLLSRAYEGV